MTGKKLPYARRPEEFTLDEWQAGLRKQFAADQRFKFSNLGEHPVYSDFEVFNPETEKAYKVSIRDNISSYNYCSCPDFKINGLSTCKHIEYLLHYFKKFKKYARYLEKPYTPDYSSLSICYGTIKKVWLRKAKKSDPLPDQELLFDEEGFLRENNWGDLASFISRAREADSEFRVYPDVMETVEYEQKKRNYDLIASNLFNGTTEGNVYSGLVKTELYPYQKEGIRKIVETRRILLADEMGLGKTVQTIAATELFARYFGVNSVLVICPTSLKYQWKMEIRKFTGRDALIIEGSPLERYSLYEKDDFYKITSYGACRNDGDKLSGFNFDLIIIDEAQRIKNWRTKTSQAVKKIESEFAIVLTGTPLENRIEDLHSLVEYIDRYKLGPLFRFLDRHQIVDDRGKLTGYKNLREIYHTLDDVLLRRNRSAISDQLPGRMDKDFYVEMTREQLDEHNYYYEIVTKLVNLWVRQGFLSDEDRERLLTSLNCMRMVCDSTYILKADTNHGNKIGELESLLDDLLQGDDNKIVIFSQWKRMFELVIRMLEQKKLKYLYLNGDIPAIKRKEIIEEFQAGDRVKIFLSTDAGGVGVNLQSANVIINLDLPWNPAVLDQRIGRIYRLGQKQHIMVYNFIAFKSIEHRILCLLDFKREVFNGVLEPGGNDQVMLEGFMESVRAMTSIDLNTHALSAVDERITHEREETIISEDHKAVTRFDEVFHNAVKNGNEPSEPQNESLSSDESIKPGPGLFSVISLKIKSFLKRLFSK